MTELENLENYYRDRSLDLDPSAAVWAVAFGVLRLAGAVEGLSRTFAPQGPRYTFEVDHFLVRLARRLDELANKLDAEQLAAAAAALTARLAPPPDGLDGDPPEAVEFLPRRKRQGRPRNRLKGRHRTVDIPPG